MTNPWIVTASAIFLWWASTGVILWRVRRADLGGPDAHLWSVLLGLPLLVGGAVAAHGSVQQADTAGVITGFLAALAIWGWIELAFLSGVLTGPVRSICPPGVAFGERLWRAIGTILWHELALIAGLAVQLHISQTAANPTAALTFATLLAARISAKLNLFFGVPRIHTEFLPRPLAHLSSHFRRSAMTAFWPISALMLLAATAFWVQRASLAGDEAASLSALLLAVLTALALLEHLFMILPVPDQKLWRWMLPAAPPPNTRPSPRPLPRK